MGNTLNDFLTQKMMLLGLLLPALALCGPMGHGRKDTGTELPSLNDKPNWEDLQALIDEHPVIVFSASYCGYSRAAKYFLSTLDIPFVYLEINQPAQWHQHIRLLLEKNTGMRTTPHIYMHGEDLKGYTDMISLGKEAVLEKFNAQ